MKVQMKVTSVQLNEHNCSLHASMGDGPAQPTMMPAGMNSMSLNLPSSFAGEASKLIGKRVTVDIEEAL